LIDLQYRYFIIQKGWTSQEIDVKAAEQRNINKHSKTDVIQNFIGQQ